jgi:hypothetical protein
VRLPGSARLLAGFTAADSASGCPTEEPVALAGLLAGIHQRQWAEEDLCRSPGATDEELGRIKRRIDALNARRADLVDRLDQWVLAHLAQDSRSTRHTETYGTVVDRLAIGWVRAGRLTDPARQPLAVAQLAELAAAYDTLLAEVESGQRFLPCWRPLKCYRAPVEVRS